jgi:carbamoyl-phosphate synthase small subunit
MTGYQEILLILLIMKLWWPLMLHIGNYGVNENEVESDGIKISGWYVKFQFQSL